MREFVVRDLVEASTVWCAYRDERGFGASTAPAAQVWGDEGQIGHVSYNGRVWSAPSPREWEPGTLPIYDPFADDQALRG